MAREIRFRVWDGNEYISLGEAVKSDVVAIYHHTGEIEAQYGACVIEQFTGLKNKNGVEIYEGDILQDTAHGANETGTVFFENGAFIIKYQNGNGQYFLSERMSYEPVVVGNIHEGARAPA